MTDTRDFSGRHEVETQVVPGDRSNCYFLFILDMTLLSFASMNLLLPGRINSCRNTAIVISKLSSTTLAWDSACSDLLCPDHPRVIYSRNQAFLCLGCRSIKKVQLRHHSGLSVLVITLASGFLW